MKDYELMTIFTPLLSEENYKEIQKKYDSFITQNGGKIVSTTIWGLKTLAYPIDKKTTGWYWIVNFTADPTFIEKIKIQLLRDENVLRHLITKLDKYAVAYNNKKNNSLAL
ncbi:MAG: 30S ribosomal protein S6 [Phycisphaerales bacterium]|nr:30S ribosomal protein S6 [Phycisphaerales bacterium]